MTHLYRTDEHHLPDLQPDFGYLRSQREHGLPSKVTMGQFDANLNNGRLAAHLEFKCIDPGCYPVNDWHELKQKNYGQWFNYASMCRMGKPEEVTFETSEAGTRYFQPKTIRAQIAVLVWHTTAGGAKESIYDFCAVQDVAAYQIMYFGPSTETPHYSPVVSGYGDHLSWLNFIYRFYGVGGTEAISLLDGSLFTR